MTLPPAAAHFQTDMIDTDICELFRYDAWRQQMEQCDAIISSCSKAIMTNLARRVPGVTQTLPQMIGLAPLIDNRLHQ